MTILTGNLQSVSGTPFGGPGHFVVIYSRITRPGFSADALILELQDRIPMTTTSGGHFETGDLDPGPIRVELEGGTVHGRGWDIDLPESGTHSLANLIDAQVEWSPAVVGRAEAAATEAAQAAVRAEADRVVVEQAATSASWSGDRLTVLGATSPPLTGPKGPEGPQGPKGDSGDGTGDVLWSDLNPVLDGKAAVSHDHTIAQVAGLQDALDGKAPATHQHDWADIQGKPLAYPPESHTHPQSEVEGLEAALAGKAAADHQHSQYATTAAVDGVSGRVATLESSAPIIVSSLPSSPLPGRIYYVTE